MALDNFIPKSNTGKCLDCKKYRKMFTCEIYPKWIPDEAMDSDCPDYELDEQKVKEQEARKAEVRKMVAEMVARAEEKKRRQQEQDGTEG